MKLSQRNHLGRAVMSNAKHTPGPWRTEQEASGEINLFATTIDSYGDERRRYIAVIEPGEHANAKLIAAAPELADRLADLHCRAAAALEHALADIPEGTAVPSVLSELEHAMRFARAALAKAHK